MNLEDYIKDLSPELQEKARACGNAEELLALAKENKVPLPDEALAAIAGGEDADGGCLGGGCPNCGSHDISYSNVGQTVWMTCRNCGHKWC